MAGLISGSDVHLGSARQVNRLLDENFLKGIGDLMEKDKRYHADVFNEVRRDEGFLKSYSNLLTQLRQEAYHGL